MECSLGVLLNQNCNNTSYGEAKELKRGELLSAEDKELLILRTGVVDLEYVCIYHERKYLGKYNHLFGQCCSDPLAIHKKVIKKGLRTISLPYSKVYPELKLIPGKSLCVKCMKIISEGHGIEDEDTQHSVDVYEPPCVTIQSVNDACCALGVSPVNIKKLSIGKRAAAIEDKVEKIKSKVAKKLYTTLTPDSKKEEDMSDNGDGSDYKDDMLTLMENLKSKMKTATNVQEKVQILSLVPKSWSKKRICSEFEVKESLVRATRKLVKKYGVLPQVEKKKSGHSAIGEDIVQAVVKFYESDDSSRMCPGKKDCVSVRNCEGVKENRQKRLVLCNLQELYVQFKTVHPDIKIGFSKFAQLRPKWCVLAGPHGTHSVCVCALHQNVKLMVEGSKITHSYKDMLAAMVCDMGNEGCMLGDCHNCPGSEAVQNMLDSPVDELLEDEVKYVQWVTTDRCDLVTIVDKYSDFVEKLVDKLMVLKTHHFTAATQSGFLKEIKTSLKENECIISGDFSENFTFVVQDEIQSYHWINAQATLHPFVVYFLDSGVLKSDSICVLSNSLQHSTTAVHTFQKHVLNRIKDLSPNITKAYYFSDGAASQYKNRKNFANICQHKTDFGLDAEWHFFATSHGKGPCDGIGGTVKRLTAKASLQRTGSGHILTPLKMFDFCVAEIKGIHFVYVDHQEIEENEKSLATRYENSIAVPNTRENHCFIPKNENIMIVRRTSSSVKYQEVVVLKGAVHTNVTNDIKVKDYVACVYGQQWWLGEVLAVCKEKKDYKINFFHPPGPSTVFKLGKSDTTWVPHSNIIRTLSAIELFTATGRTHNISRELNVEISNIFSGRH